MRGFLPMAGAMLALGGCQGPAGQVVLELNVPADPALDPLADGRATSLALYDEAAGTLLGTLPLGGASGAVLAELPVGAEARDLRLEAAGSGRQVLGLARGRAARVAAADTVRVPMLLRKPIAYFAGGQGLLSLDTVAPEGTNPSLPEPEAAGETRGVASLRDGATIAVTLAAPPALALIDTGTHGLRAWVELPMPPRRVTVDDDGRRAAVLHAEVREGQPVNAVTLLDLESVGRGGDGAPVTVTLPGAPRSATFVPGGGALLVVLGAWGGRCDQTPSASLIQRIEPDGTVSGDLDVPAFASDVALDPATGLPALALPCAGQVAIFDVSTASLREVVFEAEMLWDVALARGSLVGVGASRAPDGTLWGAVRIRDRVGGAPPRDLTFPVPRLEVVLFEHQGDRIVLDLGAANFYPEDIAVSADLTRVAFWAATEHLARSDDPACAYNVRYMSYGSYLLDPDRGAITVARQTRSARLECRLACGGWSGECREDPPAPGAFAPTAATILFGGE